MWKYVRTPKIYLQPKLCMYIVQAFVNNSKVAGRSILIFKVDREPLPTGINVRIAWEPSPAGKVGKCGKICCVMIIYWYTFNCLTHCDGYYGRVPVCVIKREKVWVILYSSVIITTKYILRFVEIEQWKYF